MWTWERTIHRPVSYEYECLNFLKCLEKSCACKSMPLLMFLQWNALIFCTQSVSADLLPNVASWLLSGWTIAHVCPQLLSLEEKSLLFPSCLTAWVHREMIWFNCLMSNIWEHTESVSALYGYIYTTTNILKTVFTLRFCVQMTILSNDPHLSKSKTSKNAVLIIPGQ